MYFTSNGFWDGGRRLIIGSHRENSENVFSVDLASGELTQITESLPSNARSLLGVFVNPKLDEVYIPTADKLLAVDLHSLKLRVLYEVPDGYNCGSMSCTADGLTVCLAITEDLSDKIHMDLEHGYVGFSEYSAARPHCQIVSIPVDGSPARVLHEEKFWSTHVNASPVLADIITFCHEGPWIDVEQRIWMLNIVTGEVKPLRKQVSGEEIGHEYWFVDGERVGYHGTKNEMNLFGWVKWDGSDGQEYDFPFGSFHYHSMDETMIVGDGWHDNPDLVLWRLKDGQYEEPRILLTHRSSFHVQCLHPHPHMFRGAEGKVQILYTSDPKGYGNVFIADVPEFESLPKAPKKTWKAG